MPIELPNWLVITLNVTGWPVIQLSLAWLMFQIPASRFDASAALYRPRRWEAGGRIYELLFAVRLWKHHLPDAARWVAGGFPKQVPRRPSTEHLSRFVAETCRAELAHWLMILCTPVFFLWNPAWADAVMIAYAVAANAPCIIAQRYNRQRLIAHLQARRG